MEAQAKISVEEHEPTNGIKITRPTPELDHQSEQMVVIPGDDVDRVLYEMAKLEGCGIEELDVLKALDELKIALKDS